MYQLRGICELPFSYAVKGLLVVQGGTNTIKGMNLANFQIVSGLATSDAPVAVTSNFGLTVRDFVN